FQSTPAIAGGRIASHPKPCGQTIFSCVFANPAITTCVCKKLNSKNIERLYKAMGCEAREPLNEKAITCGSRR
ncbi:MAG: hypothetical protein PHQ58_17995, partial [Rhodoferax sp.]|uniref:hypothetical protein n=1 Tax=Rhodoferax sp. TaxID=50421 RepID=UPI00261E43B9